MCAPRIATTLRHEAGLALILYALAAGISVPARGAVTLPPIFSDHAVLQRSVNVPVWGKAEAGEKIAVSLDGIKSETQAGADGKWQASLDLRKVESGPHELVVEGGNRIVLHDILVGEVWLCSGQSNMEFTLAKSIGAEKEIAASANPQLRQFLVKHRPAGAPMDDCDGTWMVAAPATAGAFTAVGYYFGRTLQHELGQPVGLVNSSVGGTPIEAWMNAEAFASSPDLLAEKEKALEDAKSFPARQNEFATRFSIWATRYDRADRSGDAASFAGASVDDTAWKSVKLPGLFPARGLPASGAIWLRKKINVPSAAAGQDLALKLGILHNFDTVYWNGDVVGKISPDQPGADDARLYIVPAKLVKAGEVVLAIRLYSPWDQGGVELPGSSFQAGSVPLSGAWLAKVEYELPKLSPEIADSHPQPPKKPPHGSNLPTYLFNGMIRPLVPYGLRGVLWYQGEHNAPQGFAYRRKFPLLIEAWRRCWGETLPFYFCQLPNFLPKKPVPEESAWAESRESQAKVLGLPETGMAVLIDSGEESDIHPRNKIPPGERLAAIALARTYGKDVPYCGPAYHAMSVEGDKVRVTFDHADGGLMARSLPKTYEKKSSIPSTVGLIRNSPGSELEGFAICGVDRQWRWAQAKIEGNEVIVWSAEVACPVAVRYAWASNPTCSLYDSAGFPAAPFRTDGYTLSTEAKSN